MRLRPVSKQLQFHPQRSISKIVITNPIAIRLHQISRAVSKGFLLFLVSLGVFCGAGYGGFTYYISKYQDISKEWSYLAKYHTRLGVYHQDIQDDYRDANQEVEDFTNALKIVAESEGEIIDSNNANENYGKFKLLPLNKVKEKSKDWQKSYIDVVIRLAIAKAELGDLDNAYKLVMYSTAIPIDIGSLDMRSRSLRLLSKISTLQKDPIEKSENYLIDAVRFNEIHHDDIRFKENGSLILDPNSRLNRETFESLLNLGVLYSKTDNSSKALEIFLNLLQLTEISIQRSQSEDSKSIEEPLMTDSPLLKNYIAEILYKKGLVQNSLQWAQDSYSESSAFARSNIPATIISKQSLQNTILIYERLGNLEKAKELTKILDEIVIPIRNETFWKTLKDILLT
ncbi:hypothetical protein BN7_1181 [Wickerhamomyces ciferrii]|uniref:TPR repeat-containing protein n=1 Tax=Wickerhamomyces ciferrii (strain ATCC 14091 / BCRC 22168 / CBS 111 / JCM 3599 / NBRC 0793 / NRRL Y-1031 F-60-10) TaxID=1206466 RepID=K0K9P3_WICCF|nr:uncharacterized protein BN7_1181 [Wickerhamomyces ciferrii]CCH41640.1 hypothetical protein BN7_1181 [Wickerhamomyces ciferrii]